MKYAKNRERLFSSDPQPEGRFSALHKRARICLEEAPHHEFGLFSCDLGFVVPKGGHPEGGVHLFAGGGGGIQGGSAALAPRAASWLGRYSLPEAVKAAGVLTALNEQFGEPDNPRKRRLKSLFASRSLDWVLNELKNAGLYPGEGEQPEFSSSGEWSRNDFYNGLLVALPSGSLEDTPEYAVASAWRRVVPFLTSPVRITPRGNLRLHPADRCVAERIKVLLRGSRHFPPLSIESCSCRGLPAAAAPAPLLPWSTGSSTDGWKKFCMNSGWMTNPWCSGFPAVPTAAPAPCLQSWPWWAAARAFTMFLPEGAPRATGRRSCCAAPFPLAK